MNILIAFRWFFALWEMGCFALVFFMLVRGIVFNKRVDWDYLPGIFVCAMLGGIVLAALMNSGGQ